MGVYDGGFTLSHACDTYDKIVHIVVATGSEQTGAPPSVTFQEHYSLYDLARPRGITIPMPALSNDPNSCIWINGTLEMDFSQKYAKDLSWEASDLINLFGITFQNALRKPFP